MHACFSVCVHLSDSVVLFFLGGCWYDMVDNDLKEHSSKQATSFFYVSVSLVLWSGNHLDGRKIGHCKLKLDNLLFYFGQSDDNTLPVNCCFCCSRVMRL